ncbi:hypothetical protein Kpho02_08300 [Kitasatospora phosalacinea]|uniref:Uncharacterized protein n=1 Tax=Kitasatospora phosalacinea TaxID=2065 RepID=A0A9W6Q4B0_9ACTN|nr:hypothetical protein Kpho02_08300 [Kitasatospora phosalacinea]
MFSGLTVDRDGTTVHRVARGAAALEQALAREFPGERLRFADSPRTAVELDDLARRVAADVPGLQEEGVSVTEVGPDPALGTVRVTVEDPDAARDRLAARYGPGVTVTGPGPDAVPAGG